MQLKTVSSHKARPVANKLRKMAMDLEESKSFWKNRIVGIKICWNLNLMQEFSIIL